MTIEARLFTDSEITAPPTEPIDPRVESITTQFREYLLHADFDAPKARAFRDFVDFINAFGTKEEILEREEFGPDPEIAYALVNERVQSKVSDNREYAYALDSFVSSFPEDVNFSPDGGFIPKLDTAFQSLRNELFYPKLKGVSGDTKQG